MISLVSLYRILATRKRIQDAMWQARAAVIREQLVAMRQTYPA